MAGFCWQVENPAVWGYHPKQQLMLEGESFQTRILEAASKDLGDCNFKTKSK